MSSSPAASPDDDHDHNISPPSGQICYVHCNFCDTVLAVSVPRRHFSTTVVVRCGNCTQLLYVNTRGLPPASAADGATAANIMEEIRNKRHIRNQPFGPVQLNQYGGQTANEGVLGANDESLMTNNEGLTTSDDLAVQWS